MSTRVRIKTVFLYVVFICYALFLMKLLLLSRASHFDHRSINLIPFHSIGEYMFSDSTTIKSFSFANVIGNILIFIPLGAYGSLFKKDKRIAANLLFIFIVSLFIEIVQGLLGIGASDIDDIILNSLGGLIGILGYRFLLFILRNEQRVSTVITVISAIGLPVILYLQFMVRLRL